VIFLRVHADVPVCVGARVRGCQNNLTMITHILVLHTDTLSLCVSLSLYLPLSLSLSLFLSTSLSLSLSLSLYLSLSLFLSLNV